MDIVKNEFGFGIKGRVNQKEMADWDEIRKLASDLQKAQLSSSAQKLSERNCIEIVNTLVSSGLLKGIIYTSDGKEYLTHNQLQREIGDEVFAAQGRVSIADLAQILNVDYSHIDSQAELLVKSDSSMFLVLGQLVSSAYLDTLAEEVNEKLQLEGTVSVGTITKDYNLPSDFVFEQVTKRLGSIIEGFQDTNDPKVILTVTHVSRNKAKIRGILTATKKPTAVATILQKFGIEGRLFFNLADELIRQGRLKGSITGGKQVSKAVYVPDVYAKAQNEWMDSFYAQNGYLEYDAVQRLGITDPQGTIKRRFKDEDMTFLSTCCVGSITRDLLEAQVEEALSSNTWVDTMPLLPTILSTDDANALLLDILAKKDKANRGMVLSSTSVLAKPFLTRLAELFDPDIKEKASRQVSSGAYAQAIKECGDKMDMSFSDQQSDKKEERRKRAAEGKGGGGTQGRETKTKSAKKKGGGRRHKNEDVSDEEVAAADSASTNKRGSPSFEFMSRRQLKERLQCVSGLEDASDSLYEELAAYFHPILGKKFEELMASLHQSAMTASMQSKRKVHVDFQEKTNAVIDSIRLFEKALSSFEGSDRSQLEKHLVKTLCGEVVNDVLQYLCQEHQVKQPQGDLNADQRLKVIGELPKDVAIPMSVIHKAFGTANVADFLTSLEENLPTVCDVVVRKSDRKKERQAVFNHRQSLLQQLEGCQEPSLALHLGALVLFQNQTGNMLHASGKFVPTILAKVCEKLEPDQGPLLTDYQTLVVRQISASDPEEKDALQRQLEEQLEGVKKIAMSKSKSS